MKWLIYLIIGIGMIGMINAVTLNGNLSTNFTITTNYYTVMLREGTIQNLYSVLSNNVTEYQNFTDWSSDRGLGLVYTSFYAISPSITATECINSTDNSNINCSNYLGYNNWYFYDSYIKLETKMLSGTYRIYNQAFRTNGLITVSNGSALNGATGNYVDWDSITGLGSLNNTRIANDSFLAIAWNESLMTDFDFTTNLTSSYQGLVIGRGTEMPANSTMVTYYKVMKYNLSYSNESMILQPLNAFKNDQLYGDIPNVTITNSTWWNETYPYCKNINITALGNLVNYPELITITYDSHMNTSYKDIRFINTTCNNSGTELSYEIDSYDVNIANFWVLTNLTTGINQISMYYGNLAVESTSNGSKVFSPTYNAVYHRNYINASDSTGLNINPKDTGLIDAGIIGNSINHTSDRTDLYNNISIDLANATNATVEVWTKASAGANQMFWVQSQGTCSYNFLLSTYTQIIANNNIKLCYRDQSGTTRYCVDSGLALNNSWQYVVGTYSWNGSINQSNIYVDGTFRQNRTTSYALRTGQASTTLVGHGCDYGDYTGNIDEIRVSKNTKTAEWINQTYQTIVSNNLFIVTSSEININGTTSNETNPCIYSGSGDFNISNAVCNITSNYNLLGNNAYWSNVTMINNGSISNYTIWWESGTIIDI